MKRICKKAFDSVYVMANGNVTVCAWNDVIIGNLLENTLEEIWHSDKAKELREEFLKGNLCECRENHCPFCINGDNYIFFDTEEEAHKFAQEIPKNPVDICMAYDLRCNHICPSCRQHVFKPDQQYLENIKIMTQNIEPYIKDVRMMDVNGGGEIFACPEMLDMLSRFDSSNPECRIYFETNGVLFKDNWHKVEHLAKHYLTVSVTPNSFDKETYRYLAGKDDLDAFNESFEFMSQLRKEGKINHLRVTMVVQDSNFRQIPDFIQNCLDHNADDIVLRPIFKFFCIDEDEWFFKNVQNPAHPYHKEYMEILSLPICKGDKIFNWGITQKQEPVTFREYYGGAPHKSDVEYVENRVEGIKKVVSNSDVVIYGFGNIGKILLEKLSTGVDKLNIKSIAVSCLENDKEYYFGNEICQIDNIKIESNTKVIIATKKMDFAKQMINKCLALGISTENIICLSDIC